MSEDKMEPVAYFIFSADGKGENQVVVKFHESKRFGISAKGLSAISEALKNAEILWCGEEECLDDPPTGGDSA